MGVLAGWRHLCEHLLFRREIRFDISMRRLDALVTEPQRDDGDVYPRLKQVHGRGMSNEMREYAFVSQAWTLHNRARHTFLQKIVDAMAAKRLSAGVGEGHGRIALVRFQLLEPGP